MSYTGTTSLLAMEGNIIVRKILEYLNHTDSQIAAVKIIHQTIYGQLYIINTLMLNLRRYLSEILSTIIHSPEGCP